MSFFDSFNGYRKYQNSLRYKIRWLFPILIILLIGIYGGIYAWQNPKQAQTPVQKDETADWKTYTNAQYGFEIKYPQSWFTVKDQSLILALSSKDSDGIYKEGGLYVDISYVPDWNREEMIQATDNSSQNLPKEFQIDVLKAKLNTIIKLVYIGDPPWGTSILFIKKSGTNTGIALAGAIDNSDNPAYGGSNTNLKLFNQILSTFKFRK